MKPLPLEARTKNLTPPAGRRDKCPICDDTGFVTVQTRPAQPFVLNGREMLPAPGACFDEMGPCPYCEQGHAEEFPDESKWTKSPGTRPPWGQDGFWRGRETSDVLAVSSGRPLSLAENRLRMRELAARMGAVGRNVDAV